MAMSARPGAWGLTRGVTGVVVFLILPVSVLSDSDPPAQIMIGLLQSQTGPGALTVGNIGGVMMAIDDVNSNNTLLPNTTLALNFQDPGPTEVWRAPSASTMHVVQHVAYVSHVACIESGVATPRPFSCENRFDVNCRLRSY